MISDVCTGKGLTESANTDCNIKTPYKPDQSSTFDGDHSTIDLSAKVAMYNDKDYQTQEIKFNGYMAKETFGMTYTDYSRNKDVTVDFLGVTSMSE